MDIADANWVLGDVVGEGSFGTVRLALETCQGRVFAVKSSASQIPSLQNEYRALSSLNSPYIVRCLGHCYTVEKGMKFYNLLMEYASGGCLADLLVQIGKVDEWFIRRCTREILLGLEYIHEQGLVHCDIKARNILVDSEGHIKIADFGSAKKAEGDVALSEMRGTPLWMAPEVIRKEEQGPASDVWSMGCTVLEIATGRPPWCNEDNLVEALRRIAFTEELPRLPPFLSGLACDFLQKCLARDPRKRWTTKQLLSHPFVDLDFCGDFKGPPLSPTSPLDFERIEQQQKWADECSSCSSSHHSNDCSLELDRNFEDAELQSKKLSPRQRVLQLASLGREETDWFVQFIPLEVQWIVVRNSHACSANISSWVSQTQPCLKPTTNSSVECHATVSLSSFSNSSPNNNVKLSYNSVPSSLARKIPSSQCLGSNRPSSCPECSSLFAPSHGS
eukprot:TRINITY_DN5263_c0_g3_i1.p1 TRINITY_DN5263_c0_g3~~TRINITY_DN5263_c0_g3_i1.p1  ORF type:complete len:448 (+),score=76.38 TRINITY_DN5263_c0_g3_i1:920-2263(+)